MLVEKKKLKFKSVAAASLIAFLFLVSCNSPGEPEKAEAISSITVNKGKNQLIELEREDSSCSEVFCPKQWYISSLPDFMLNAKRLASFLKAVKALQFEKVFSVDSESRKEMGFDTPALELTISWPSRKSVLQFGRQYNLGDRRYLLLDSGEGTLIDESIFRALMLKTDELLSFGVEAGEVCFFDTEKLKRIALLRESDGRALEVGEQEDQWFVSGLPGDILFIKKFFRDLAGLTPIGISRKLVPENLEKMDLEITVEADNIYKFGISPFKGRGDSKPGLYYLKGHSKERLFIIDNRSYKRIFPSKEILLPTESFETIEK